MAHRENGRAGPARSAARTDPPPLRGHALRNANLCRRSLARAETAPPLARTLVRIRAETLGMTRLEFARRSGIGRGTLRDVELGIHCPTRRTLQRFLAYCQRRGVCPGQLEELRALYAGPAKTLGQFVARLELQAGSARMLARRIGISPATLWEYRRGNFPLPLPLLRRLCQAAGEDAAVGERLWYQAERQRLLERGYPEALAEFWTLAARAGYADKDLTRLGMGMAAVRRLRYLELPPWALVETAARRICQDEDELRELQRLWLKDLEGQRRIPDGFGVRLKKIRERQGIPRRELAELFALGGKKPARILKYIEEDGFYSAQAYPAGLAALLTDDAAEQARLLELWRTRRRRFHLRHRPETRTDLRLTRELYGLELTDMQAVLGYSSREYQRIERGVEPLTDSARVRILDALHRAGQVQVEALLRRRRERAADRDAWQRPPSVTELLTRLARREGGLIPLWRHLRQAGIAGLSVSRLRAIAKGQDLPAWPAVERLASVCGVDDLAEVRVDWRSQFQSRLARKGISPLGIELRLLILEAAPTVRAFSTRLPGNYTVLIRVLRRLDGDEPVRWRHVERILRAAGLGEQGERWREIRGLWQTAAERRRAPKPQPLPGPSTARRLA
jgi:transcriptional regulator with XRE-family HTH domain